MTFYRTIADGIGTAAGVACPFFGIISASLSLKIGGSFAIILGSCSLILFAAIAVSVFLIAYFKNQADETELNKKVLLNTSEFIDNLCILKKSGIDCTELLKSDSLPYDLFCFIENNYPSFLPKYLSISEDKNSKIISTILNEYYLSSDLDKKIKPVSTPELIKVFFINSAAIFGTIAGSSAGLMGIAMGLGFLSGFGAIPAVGVGIIILATIAAVAVASQAIEATIKTNQKTQLYKGLKQSNRSLNNLNLAWNTPKFEKDFSSVNSVYPSKTLNFFEKAIELPNLTSESNLVYNHK
ncbi:MAG: hypothetical protein H0U70_09625 [Tatlockia sp.]|nr:hypothetical protein [Tatlockia sp.]